MNRRIWAILLVVVMAISMVPMTAMAADTDCNHIAGGWTSNNNGTHTSRCECGQNTTTGECQTLNGTSCYMCGYIMNVPCKHEWKGVTYKDEASHNIVCRDCREVLSAESHMYVDGRPCACGAIYSEDKKDHECTFDAGVTSNNDGTHNINCTCGSYVQVGCLDNDGDGKCDSCGYIKYVAPDEAPAQVASTAGLDNVPKTGCAFVEWLYALIFG